MPRPSQPQKSGWAAHRPPQPRRLPLEPYPESCGPGGSRCRLRVGPCILAFAIFTAACIGEITQPDETVTVTLSPSAATVTIGKTQQFRAVVTGSYDRSVAWYVNDVPGGDTTLGTMNSIGYTRTSTTGLYTAPQYPPASATVTVRAVSRADTSKGAAATVTIAGPVQEPLLLWATYFQMAGLGTMSNGFPLRRVVIDRHGNVIAAGLRLTNDGTPRAVALSTDNLGRERWTHVYDGPATAYDAVLAPDLTSVYVMGGAGDFRTSTPLIFAVDSAGNEQFERTCSELQWAFSHAAIDDRAIYMTWGGRGGVLILADLAGNPDCANPKDVLISDLPDPVLRAVLPFHDGLAVTGTRFLTNQCFSQGYTTLVQRLSSAGDLMWRFDFDSLFAPSIALSPQLTVGDGGEALYVAASRIEGCVVGTDGGRYMTAKLSSSGNLEWFDLWNGNNSPSSCEAFPADVVADPRGGVIMAGLGSTDCDIAWDCAVASYTAGGQLRWTMAPRFQGNRNNACSSAAVTADGRFLYLAGWTGVTIGDAQSHFIAKYALPK